MALAKSTATPTHFFTPKFKKGDICRLKNHKISTELNGLTVTILAPLSVVTSSDFPNEIWLGYETDLCYRDRWIYPRESQLVKIGERA